MKRTKEQDKTVRNNSRLWRLTAARENIRCLLAHKYDINSQEALLLNSAMDSISRAMTSMRERTERKKTK